MDELLERGAAHHRAGRLDEAAQAYDEILRRSPTHAVALSLRGAVLLQRNAPAEALGFLDRSLAARPNAGVHLNRGNALRGLGRLEESAEAYRSALQLDPTLIAARSNLGNVLKDQGDLTAAIAEYRRTVADAPDFFPARANLAHALAATGEEEQALQCYGDAIESPGAKGARAADLADCHVAVGRIHARHHRIEEAIAAYEEACKLQPPRADDFRDLSRILESAARYEASETALRRAMELAPASVEHHSRLALLLRRLGRDDEAGEVYRDWHARAPGDPIAAHMAMAFGTSAPAPTASADYVRQEFDAFAGQFDETLRTKLEYRVPEIVAGVLPSLGLDDSSTVATADLGCGTGLCAEYLRPISHRLVGVDLSPRMLDVARTRGLYDDLVEAEIMEYCLQNPAAFSLLIAADVLVYIGALEPLLAAARGCLRDHGWFVFTVEDGGEIGRGYALNPGGRYTHDVKYLRGSLEAAGFSVVSTTKEALRTEMREPVSGWLVVARASPRRATP